MTMAFKNDISNLLLGKIMSVDFLIVIVAMGVGWGTLTQRVSGLDNKIEANKLMASAEIIELKAESSNVKQEVSQINRKLDVMGNNQEHFKEQITGLDQRSVQMLRILQKETENF
jgi:FtsZ-binding cell division protein ZapB